MQEKMEEMAFLCINGRRKFGNMNFLLYICTKFEMTI